MLQGTGGPTWPAAKKTAINDLIKHVGVLLIYQLIEQAIEFKQASESKDTSKQQMKHISRTKKKKPTIKRKVIKSEKEQNEKEQISEQAD